jgi:DNA-binding CsgD family transcriptional regulator
VEAARAQVVAARALAARQRRDEALEQLRSAVETFDACGVRRDSETARVALKRLGDVRGFTPRGEAGILGLAALTGREAEIADLVWDRRTNREIADTLFLSTKTIETHLRNIFFKVGVSTRVELARAVERSKTRVDTR